MPRFISLLLLFAVFSINAFGEDKADSTKVPAPKASEAKPTAPRNTAGDRKFESTIAAVESKAGLTQITLQNDDLRLALKPDTQLVREERGLVASDLRKGDMLCLIALKGQRSKLSIKEAAIVTEINPLTIEIGNAAKMIMLQNDQWEFYRATPITPQELKAGQTVAVRISLKRDGDIITRRVAVVVGKPLPAKRKPKAPVLPKEKPAAGNN